MDNAIIHVFPNSPYIVKAAVNIRAGNKILFGAVLRDADAARNWLARRFPELPYRVINHK